MYKALREATISVALRELHDRPKRAFRIIHISIQHDHVHLIVEADNRMALSRGMQSFQISAAKHLNRAVTIASMKAARKGLPLTREQRRELSARRRRGTVFPDRFHQEIITTPKQARHTLAYVLNNWRKHREDRGALERTWSVDPFSTGVLFDGWKERENEYVLWRWCDTYDPLVVYLPKTWLLREGWRRHGLVGFRAIPSVKQVGLARVDAG
jgi:REP element-mobilizing transposase RayT